MLNKKVSSIFFNSASFQLCVLGICLASNYEKRTNLLNLTCWESSENIGTGRQKPFCPLEGKWQTPKTHLPPVSPSRGAIFLGQKLTWFLIPSFLLPKQELMDSPVKRVLMVTQIEGDPLIWPGIFCVNSELLFGAGRVWAASSGSLRCTSSCSDSFAGCQGLLEGWKSKPSQRLALSWCPLQDTRAERGARHWEAEWLRTACPGAGKTLVSQQLHPHQSRSTCSAGAGRSPSPLLPFCPETVTEKSQREKLPVI